MTSTEATTVRRQVVVEAPLERAFAVFTERFGEIKPAEHTLLAAPLATSVLEPRVGGHIVDRAVDGTECRWARILAYEPPHRIVFSWDIDPQWQLETDPELTSEVEVRFVAEGPGRTRVELEHRHLDRHGPGWRSMADGVDAADGWPLYLDRYTAAVQAQSPGRGGRTSRGPDQPGPGRPGPGRPGPGRPGPDQPGRPEAGPVGGQSPTMMPRHISSAVPSPQTT